MTVGRLAALLLLWVGCSKNDDAQEPLVVFAAASLNEVLEDVAAHEDTRLRLHFAATPRLAAQLDEGAYADVIVSADEAWMDELSRERLVDVTTRVDVAANELVLIAPAAATAMRSTEELRSAPRIAIANESVPAGRYARRVLEDRHLTDATRPRWVEGESVRTVLGWVASGEADAGFVYATDAQVEARVRVVDRFEVDVRYPAAVASGSRQAQPAAAFVRFLASPEGRALFLARGFRAP